MFKTKFSERNKIWGHKKDLGLAAPECTPRLRAWAEPLPKCLPLRAFTFVQGG